MIVRLNHILAASNHHTSHIQDWHEEKGLIAAKRLKTRALRACQRRRGQILNEYLSSCLAQAFLTRGSLSGLEQALHAIQGRLYLLWVGHGLDSLSLCPRRHVSNDFNG